MPSIDFVRNLDEKSSLQQMRIGAGELEDRFRVWQRNHPNFLTPEIVDLLAVDGFVIEVSRGTDFQRNPIFAVTVARWVSGNDFTTQEHRFTELSRDPINREGNRRYTLSEQRQYAQKVRNRIRRLEEVAP